MKISIMAIWVMLMVCFVSCNNSDPIDTLGIDRPIVEVPEVIPDPIEIPDPEPFPMEKCDTDGGMSDDIGFKIWCWGDNTITETDQQYNDFSNGHLVTDSEANIGQITVVGDKLSFYLDPVTPSPAGWSTRNFNVRAEIRNAPWPVQHPLGTEEWFGWTVKFDDGYIADQGSQWSFFQIHNGEVGQNPLVALEVIKAGQFSDHVAGEIYVHHEGHPTTTYSPTSVEPVAGQVLKIVVHVIWGTLGNGLLEVWLDDSQVYSEQAQTIATGFNYGGNAKWGIYKWPWALESGVQKSLQQGITHLEIYMGPLRMITRRPEDPDYLENSYSEVEPR